MINDCVLLGFLSNKDNLEKYLEYINQDSLDNTTKTLIRDFKNYFEAYDVDHIDMDTFYSWQMSVAHPTLKSSTAELYFNIVSKALNVPLDSPTALDIIKHYRNIAYAAKIADAALAIETMNANSQEQLNKIQSILAEYDSTESADTMKMDNLLDYMDLEDTLNIDSSDAGLNWRLPELRKSVGPLRLGDLAIIAARPEVGKTAFTLSEATYMATQLPDDRPVLICSNEEQLSSIKKRVLSAVLNKPLKDIYKLPLDTVSDEFAKRLGSKSKVCFYHNAQTTKRDLEAIFKHVNPGLIVIDQLDNVSGFKGDREDIALGKMYRWARQMASIYCPIMVVSQVDASGDGQKFLSMAQLDGAKTRKQAAADLIILIGHSYEAGEEKSRWLNIRKNKLSGDENTEESLRHATHEVTIDSERSRYSGVLK